jgi:hypothetical protein
MSEENKRLSRAFTEYVSTGDAALADEVLDREVVFHGPSGVGDLIGSDAVKGMFLGFRAAFPDERSAVVDQVAEGDMTSRIPAVRRVGVTGRGCLLITTPLCPSGAGKDGGPPRCPRRSRRRACDTSTRKRD